MRKQLPVKTKLGPESASYLACIDFPVKFFFAHGRRLLISPYVYEVIIPSRKLLMVKKFASFEISRGNEPHKKRKSEPDDHFEILLWRRPVGSSESPEGFHSIVVQIK